MLRDPEKRRQYESMGHDSFHANTGFRPGSTDFKDLFKDFEDLFKAVFRKRYFLASWIWSGSVLGWLPGYGSGFKIILIMDPNRQICTVPTYLNFEIFIIFFKELLTLTSAKPILSKK